MKLTREKCLELAKEADPTFGNEKVFLSDSIFGSDRIESLVRASVALGMEMAAKECDNTMDSGPDNGCCPTYWNEALERAENRIRKLAEEIMK